MFSAPLNPDDFSLPNIRKVIVPDFNYMLYDADLKGADAQVVAWEAEDEDLKAAFRAGLDIHTKNAEDMLGDAFRRLEGYAKYAKRKQLKVGVHATNYGASPRSIAISQKWTTVAAREFQQRWFNLHPGVREWHKRTDFLLKKGRRITNKFGYHKIYFDRLDGLLPQALAWVPQSTVAQVTFAGAQKLGRLMPHVEFLMQVHDSLVFQIHKSELPTDEELSEALKVAVPYRDPLYIPWNIAKSDVSWGACE